jgi:hypothetical protein
MSSVLLQLNDTVKVWCEERGRPEPFYCFECSDTFTEHPAGLYSAILQRLKCNEHLKIGDVSELAAEAKKHLEALLLKTKDSSSSGSSSNVPMIVVNLFGMDEVEEPPCAELQQLFEWSHTAGSRLIVVVTSNCGWADAATLQHEVVFKPFARHNLIAILSANVGRAVQPAALELCAVHSFGNARYAAELCRTAIKLADTDLEKNSCEATLCHAKQAISYVDYMD